MRHVEAKKEGKSLIEYGATSDTTIDESHPVRDVLKDTLNITGVNVTNKSGKNLQFSLGNIPEFKKIQSATEITHDFVSNLLCKYLKKSNSVKPADILVYKYTNKKKWIFFNIVKVIEYIAEKGKWRKLESGRYKCDFDDGTNTMGAFNASTTVGTVSLVTNNSFTASEKRYVDIGTPATSPTKISCTVLKTYAPQ